MRTPAAPPQGPPDGPILTGRVCETLSPSRARSLPRGETLSPPQHLESHSLSATASLKSNAASRCHERSLRENPKLCPSGPCRRPAPPRRAPAGRWSSPSSLIKAPARSWKARRPPRLPTVAAAPAVSGDTRAAIYLTDSHTNRGQVKAKGGSKPGLTDRWAPGTRDPTRTGAHTFPIEKHHPPARAPPLSLGLAAAALRQQVKHSPGPDHQRSI